MDKQKSSKIRLFSLIILIICNVLLPANPASSAAIQKIYYTIAGDCVDYYDENDEYAFFEDEPDWSCYIKVKTSTPKPIRTVAYNIGILGSGYKSQSQKQALKELLI